MFLLGSAGLDRMRGLHHTCMMSLSLRCKCQNLGIMVSSGDRAIRDGTTDGLLEYMADCNSTR